MNTLEQIAHNHPIITGLAVPAVFGAGMVIYDLIRDYSERKMMQYCFEADRKAGIDPSKGSTAELAKALAESKRKY